MARQISKLERSLYRRFAQAVREFDLIQDGDRIMVAVSGGKDSYALLHFLDIMRRRAPVRFDLIAVHLDQAQPGYDGRPLEGYLQEHGYDYRLLHRDTYSIVVEKTLPGQAYCFMCSRLRRGILYQAALELGCTKIALGHHRDDALETLMLNLIFSGQLKAMPPKLVSDDRRNTVIRPLIYCGTPELKQLAVEHGFPILPCNLCGTQENLQRVAMRTMLDQIEAANPGARNRMLAALINVRPSHLLDRKLWDALQLPGLASTLQRPPPSVAGLAEAEEAESTDELSLTPLPLTFHDGMGFID